MNSVEEIVARLKSQADPEFRGKMSHFGIPSDKALGIRVPAIRAIAKEINAGPKAEKAARAARNHALALDLWETGIHEARTLAPMIASPELTTEELIDKWTADFAAWDTCDLCIGNLFRYTPFAYDKIYEYVRSEDEFVRRTGFVLMAELAVADKKAPDAKFLPMLPLIEEYSTDSRNFVRKAVNWALRQIGKRSQTLHPHALALAEKLSESGDKTARWIGSDARRELTDPKIIARIALK